MPAWRACEVLRRAARLALQIKMPARRLELAEQGAGEFELAATHEAIDAEHLAGMHVELTSSKARP